MAARKQTGDSELNRLVLAYNDFTNLVCESLDVIGHAGMICGNTAFRKHGVGGKSFQLVTFARSLVSSLNLINQVFLRILAIASQGRAASSRVFGPLSCSCSCSCLSLFCGAEF
jgi:hypothetical protein